MKIKVTREVEGFAGNQFVEIPVGTILEVNQVEDGLEVETREYKGCWLLDMGSVEAGDLQRVFERMPSRSQTAKQMVRMQGLVAEIDELSEMLEGEHLEEDERESTLLLLDQDTEKLEQIWQDLNNWYAEV